jgi:hypothetical protein
MFGLSNPTGHPRQGPAASGVLPVCGREMSVRAILRLGLVVLPLAAGLPGGASAQALGTMQATARVLPGGAAWSGLGEARILARHVILSSPAGPDLRRGDLVLARAELASTGGRRHLLVRVDYPRN